MEQNSPLDSEIHALEVTSESREYLLTTAKWGRFIAIVGIVFMVLFLLAMLFAGGSMFSVMSEFDQGPGAAFSSTMGSTFVIIYMIFVFAIGLFPLYYLYSFSTKTIRAIQSSSTEGLTDGLKNLKSLFKFYGIFMSIVLGLYAFIIVGAMIAGLAM